VAVIGRYQIA
jgi:hypothetical protein